MGSKGMKRARRPKSGGQAKTGAGGQHEGFPSFEHNAFTFEGEIERMGAIGRNLSSGPRWARVVAKTVVFLMLLVFAIGLVQFLLRMVTG